jgi:predicted ATPase
MPGKKLSLDEKKLLAFWEMPLEKTFLTTLRSISIDSETGLRGITGLFVPFRYPVTAICGNNGAGKSTVLALCALAHHSPPDWFVHRGNPGKKRNFGDRSYYTFSDFFVNGRGERTPNDIEITWRYIQNKKQLKIEFKNKTGRWDHYSRRPEREVDFLSLARIIPAYEMSTVLNTFKDPGVQYDRSALDDFFLQRLSFIMGKEYKSAEVQRSRNYTFQQCDAGGAYTAFNMGGGEYCVIELLHLLQRIPQGGMLVVEEIEAGLHPQAQIRLAESLIQICLKKYIQIICSTHSEIFLDALPRQARLIIKKAGDEHIVYDSPSTRFAMYEMTGKFHPELVIYCEDVFAKILIEEALFDEKLRLRVNICDVGDTVTVIRQGVSHIRSGFRMNSLCVLDGDCKDNDVKKWINSETGGQKKFEPNYIFLPSDGMAPEKWILEQLKHEAYQNEFTTQFNCSLSDAKNHLEAIKTGLDHHKMVYILHQRTNLDEMDCLHRVIRSVAPRHPQLDGLRDKVSTLLD